MIRLLAIQKLPSKLGQEGNFALLSRRIASNASKIFLTSDRFRGTGKRQRRTVIDKRALKGTYVAVAPWHLFRYLDEEADRFNERKGNDAARFVRVVGSVVGKQLTYAQLAGRLATEGGIE